MENEWATQIRIGLVIVILQQESCLSRKAFNIIMCVKQSRMELSH